MSTPLRVSKNYAEIAGILFKMYQRKTTVILMQDGEGAKVQSEAFISDIDPKKGFFVLSAKSEGDLFIDFKKNLSIYLRGDEQSILFKGESLGLNDKKLVMAIPREVRLFEKRSNGRIPFNPFDHAFLTLIENAGAPVGKKNPDRVGVFDISQTGAGFYLNEIQTRSYYEGDMIKILDLVGIDLDFVLDAKVLYIRPFEYMDNGVKKKDFRLGIMFKTPLPPDLLKKIMDLSHRG